MGRGLGGPLPTGGFAVGRGFGGPLPRGGFIVGRGFGAPLFTGRVPPNGFLPGRVKPPPAGLPLPIPASMGFIVGRDWGAELTVRGFDAVLR